MLVSCRSSVENSRVIDGFKHYLWRWECIAGLGLVLVLDFRFYQHFRIGVI